MSKIKDLTEYQGFTDSSLEEWKEEALEFLEKIYKDYDTRAMNPSSSSHLGGQKQMLGVMKEFIRGN